MTCFESKILTKIGNFAIYPLFFHHFFLGAAHTFLGEHPNAIPASGEAYFFNKDKFYTQGFAYYRKYFLRRYRDKSEPFIHYEKSPTYYRSLTAPPRMKHMNETLKIVNVVCDNVKRTLSRYLHIKVWKAKIYDSWFQLLKNDATPLIITKV